MKSPKISVIIPSYNKVRYIENTLNSIVNQNYLNYEVIIQDGGSTDGTLDVIKKYATNYPDRIYYQSGKDDGQLDAVNKGIKKATGDIITFINADDYYEDDAFTVIGDYYKKYPEATWFAGEAKVINALNNQIEKPVSLYKNLLLKINKYPLLIMTNYLMQPSVFINHKAYMSYGQFIGTKDFIMEYDLWLKLGKIKMPQTVNKNLSFFRIESNTKTKLMFNKLLDEDEKIVKKYTNSQVLLFMHFLHNSVRRIIGRFI